MKPKALCFEGFGIDYRWNYFMLELEELEPILTTDKDQLSEYLVEDTPGHYVSAQNAPYKVYDYDSGEKLPEGFRVVMRYLRGKFLITEKYGPYNGIAGVYDARHNMCETWKFREYISKLLTITNAVKQAGIEEDQVLHQFNANPFTPPMENLPSTSWKTMKEYIEKSVKKWDFGGGLRMDEPCGKISVIFQLNKYKLCRDGFFHQNPKNMRTASLRSRPLINMPVFFRAEKESLREVNAQNGKLFKNFKNQSFFAIPFNLFYAKIN